MELLTTEQVAELLGVSPKSVINLVKNKRFPCVKVSQRILRFNRCEVLAWLGQQDFHTLKSEEIEK